LATDCVGQRWRVAVKIAPPFAQHFAKKVV
jgi:hypothetical protein